MKRRMSPIWAVVEMNSNARAGGRRAAFGNGCPAGGAAFETQVAEPRGRIGRFLQLVRSSISPCGGVRIRYIHRAGDV